MSTPASWSGTAFNPVPGSENRIHSDDVARAHGFRGGLVPGVVVSAYLLHPAAVAWGRDWLDRGRAHVVVSSPVYDGEPFRVEVENPTAASYDARLVDPHGTRCATVVATLPGTPSRPPERRGDALLPADAERPVASREFMEELRERGLGALRARWSQKAEITNYLRDPAAMAPVFREEGLANPGFVLGLSNWLLARNARMDAWLHLETHSEHYRAIPPETALVAEGAIGDLFEKKGHQFVDVEVGIFAEPDDAALARVRLRAIYRLRGA